MTTEAEKHAARRLKEAVKYTERQWGFGWKRLSAGQQEAMVRAEMLAEIHRAQGLGEPATYRELVEAMTAAAMAWEGTP